MKLISRDFTVYRHVFGKYDPEQNAIVSTTAIETAEKLSGRKLASFNESYGSLLSTTEEKKTFALPADLFMVIGNAYAAGEDISLVVSFTQNGFNVADTYKVIGDAIENYKNRNMEEMNNG